MSEDGISSADAPARRPGGRSAQVADRIAAVTLELLEEGGYGALSLKEVAERAGVGRATLYRRWGTRAALVVGAMEREIREAIVIPDTGSLRGDLATILEDIGAFLGTRLGGTIIAAGIEMRQASDHVPASSTLWTTRARDLRPVFDRARARGEIDARFDDEAVFAMLAGALYFRVLVMTEAADAVWIARVLAAFPLGEE